jgi:hypothetical protein
VLLIDTPPGTLTACVPDIVNSPSDICAFAMADTKKRIMNNSFFIVRSFNTPMH